MALLTAILTACATADSTVTPPTASVVPTPRVTPSPAPKSTTDTPEPLSTETGHLPLPGPEMDLLDALRAAQPGQASFSVEGIEDGPHRTEAATTGFTAWFTDWLSGFTSPDTGPSLRLDNFEVQEVEVWLWSQLDPEDIYTITAHFALKPTAGTDSLWYQTGRPLDDMGWLQHDGLVFQFRRQDQIYEFVEIYPNWPEDIALQIDASQVEGLSDADLARDLMAYWLDGYLSDDLLPDMQLDAYAVDSIELHEQNEDWAKFDVEFSVDLTVPYNYTWGYHDRFSGFFSDADQVSSIPEDLDQLDQIEQMIRYIGVRREAGFVYLESLDREGLLTARVYEEALVEGTPEEIATLIYERMLSDLTQPDVSSCRRLLDYNIDYVGFLEQREDYLGYEVVYSVQPRQLADGLKGCYSYGAGNGLLNPETHWVEGKQVFALVHHIDDYYELIKTVTGGPLFPDTDSDE